MSLERQHITLIVLIFFTLCATIHAGTTKDILQKLHHRHVSLYVSVCVCVDVVYGGEGIVW